MNIQNKNVKVLIDAIHLFPLKNNRLYKNDAEVYSIRKALFLNNGSIAYTNGKLLKTEINLDRFNVKVILSVH